MDFGAIYCCHVKEPHSSPAMTITTAQLAITDMPFNEWLPIFLAFQSEHLRAFPKDAVTMPAHFEQIVKMKNTGMQWHCYDVICRQKRGKRIARGCRKVGGWATLHLVLYLECQAAKWHGRQVGQKGPTQRPSMGLRPSQAPLTGHKYQHIWMRELHSHQWHPSTPEYVLKVPREGLQG